MAPKKVIGDKFAPKELVMAKMPGFPAWPSFVMPQNLIPGPILKAKKKTTDYCVIFIPDGDFYWMSEKSLELLPRETLAKKLEKVVKPVKKSKTGRATTVAEALLAAKDLQFDAFMRRLEKAAGVDNEEEDEEEEKEEDEEEEEEDKYIEDDTPSEHKNSTSDKARAAAEDNAEDDDVENSALAETEVSKLAKRRTVGPRGYRKRAKNALPVTPPKANNSGASNHGSHHKKGDGASEPLNDDDKQHQLWLCRIKLQRSLIQRNQPVTPEDPSKFPQPTADELLVARLILHRLVDFPVTVELLKQTKIHKVLKCILRDETLEYADSFRLHEKCEELLQKWAGMIEAIKLEKLAKMLSADGAKEGVNGSNSSAATTTTGEHAGEESEISAVDKADAGAQLKFGELHS